MNSMSPVIRQALGSAWEDLHPTVRRHYDLTPGEASETVLQGTMREISHSRVAKLFLLPGRIFGALIPWQGENIPATVRNWTLADDAENLYWHRRFIFPRKGAVTFSSRMVYPGGREIIEYVKFGLGIRMRLSVEKNSLVYRSLGYQWDIGHLSVRFPDWLILGTGTIVERGLSDDEFEMDFQMHHPWFGRTFAYSGVFSFNR